MSAFRIISTPSQEQWNAVMQHTDWPHFNQTWEWGEFYADTLGIRPLRFLVLKNNTPVAALQAFSWKRFGLPLGVVSGGSGEGGEPIFIRDLSKQAQQACYTLLLREVFAYFRYGNYFRFLLFTPPGDHYAPAPIAAKVAEKCTPILRLPKTKEDFLHSLGHEGRRELKIGKKKGLVLTEGKKEDLAQCVCLQRDVVRAKRLAVKHVNTLSDWERLWDIFSSSPWRIRFFIGKKDDVMVGVLMTIEVGNTFFLREAVSNLDGKKLLVNNALYATAILDAIEQGLGYCNMTGGTRDTKDPRYGITQFKLTFRPELTDFRRYSATGNRMLNACIEKLRRFAGYRMWFPPGIYP